MTYESEFDFKTRFRQLLLEQLAREAVNGGSWKKALEDLKEIFEIEPAEVEREIATLLELKAMDKDIAAVNGSAPIDLGKERANRTGRAEKEKEKEREREKENEKEKEKRGRFAPAAGKYGSGVRDQVFEVVVRQGMSGAPWRSICAGPMRVNNIDPDDIQEEIDRRMGRPGGSPKQRKDDDQDDDPPKSGGGSGGSPKNPVPKKPFPFLGGASKTLSLPGKKKGKDALAKDVKSHDQKSHDQRSSSAKREDDDEHQDAEE